MVPIKLHFSAQKTSLARRSIGGKIRKLWLLECKEEKQKVNKVNKNRSGEKGLNCSVKIKAAL